MEATRKSGAASCTVEWREYQDGDFRHWIAGFLGGDTETNITIPGNGTHFSIKANERLSNENVKVILTAFAADKITREICLARHHNKIRQRQSPIAALP
jgi:hypothetical protein